MNDVNLVRASPVLPKAFRDLRIAWFNKTLYIKAHEREWETEEDESYREEINIDNKYKYNLDTEAIICGEDRPVHPFCMADVIGTPLPTIKEQVDGPY